jgi:long-chain acyl-CoA synthetase
MPIVTAYETLGEEGLRQSILATKARAVFTDVRLLETLGRCLENSKIECIIYNDDRVLDTVDIDAFKAQHPSLRIVSFEELRTLGKENPTDPVPPQTEDLCCIMYTSGTTGTPKGVRLKHRNIVAAGTYPSFDMSSRTDSLQLPAQIPLSGNISDLETLSLHISR